MLPSTAVRKALRLVAQRRIAPDMRRVLRGRAADCAAPHAVARPLVGEVGSGPWRITFDTNPDTCNLTCTMCEEHSPYSPLRKERLASKRPKREMDIELMRRVVEECAPHGLREVIPTTMGEPLLFKGMPEIIELCADYGVRLNLTTNGTWPGRGPVEWARLIVPVGSDVKVSWNGASSAVQDSVMLGSRFERQLRRLKQFLAVRDEHEREHGHRCTVTLQLTFMESNLRDMPRLVELAYELGVDRIKGHHLWVHFPEMADQNLRRSPESVGRWNRTSRECAEVASARVLAATSRPVRLENFEELDPATAAGSGAALHADGVCPFLGREAWVNHAGRFDPCCAPDAERRSLGSFGNVEAGGLLPLWRSGPYRHLRENYLENELCQRCNMRRVQAD